MPLTVGTITESTSSENALRWGVMMSNRKDFTLFHLVDAADHINCLLGFCVVLSLKDLLKSADCFLERHVFACPRGKCLGHEHRMGQKPLVFTGAGPHELVF